MGKHELSKLKKEKVLQEKIVKELSGDKENAKPDVSARSNRKSGSKELKISDINNILSDAGFVQNSSTINSSAMGKLEKLVKLLNNRMGLKSDDDKMSVWYIPEASQYAINRGIDRQKWKRNEYGIMERYYDNILGFKSDGQSMESIDASFLKQKLSDTYYPLKKSDDVSKAFDDLLEKGTYKNNAENRKLGRVGNTYGGAKEKQAEARSNRTGASAINIENVRNMMTQSDIKHNSPIGVTGALEKLRKLSTLINKQMGLKSDDEKVSAHYLPEARSYVLNRGVNAHKWRATQHGIRERYVDNIISFKSDSYTTESIDPIVLSDFLKRTYKDDSLEKGIYVNNAENRKEGRVGQKYGGKKEMSQGNARAYREGGKPDESKNQIKIGRNIGGDDLKGVSLANKEDRHKHILSKMGVFAIGGVVQLYDMKNGFSGAVKIVSKDGDKFTGYRVNDLATPNGTEEWKAKRNMQIFTRENATHFRMGRTSHATKEAVDNYIGRFKKYDDIEEPKK